MKKFNKPITILGRKTDIILLVSACFLTMLITLNTMCSCVNSKDTKKCDKKTCDKKNCDKNKPKDVDHIAPNMQVDEIEGVNRSVFYENEMTL